jgi:hypothetical protein
LEGWGSFKLVGLKVFDLGLDQRRFVFEIGSISKIIVENSQAWGLD